MSIDDTTSFLYLTDNMVFRDYHYRSCIDLIYILRLVRGHRTVSPRPEKKGYHGYIGQWLHRNSFGGIAACAHVLVWQ